MKTQEKKTVNKATYYKSNGLLLSLGNKKIGNDTLILNMGSAAKCPSRKLGFCKLNKRCYARKAEYQYPPVRDYRESQANYWLNTSKKDIAGQFIEVLTTKRCRNTDTGKLEPLYKSIKYLRFNESGDFYSQECVEKLDYIAEALIRFFDIVTYGYTARKDLNFSQVSFLVKGSGYDNGNNGMTIASEEAKTGMPYATLTYSSRHNNRTFIVCPMDCRECTLCKVRNGVHIAFPLH